MLSFTGSLKVLLVVEPCDLRKSFNGLHGSGHRAPEDLARRLCLHHRRRTRLKMLCWDGTGSVGAEQAFGEVVFSRPKIREAGHAGRWRRSSGDADRRVWICAGQAAPGNREMKIRAADLM